MKILCPTDFSSAATNGIEYAAKLAQKMNATLTLLNVQPLYINEGVNLFAGGELESMQEAKVSEKILDDICLDIKKTFNLSCSHEVIPTLSSFEKIVDDESWKFNLIVIGTNGADNLYQFYFGTHSFRLAKKTKCPVLIVPENSSYEDISNVVFASGYIKGDELLLQQLKQFIAQLTTAADLKLQVLHISENDTPVSREVYHSFCNLTEEVLGNDQVTAFERIVNKKAVEGIENYMNKIQFGILAVCMEEHGFLYRIFNENLVNKLTAFPNYPVLVFHK